jgi:hypothetical protein
LSLATLASLWGPLPASGSICVVLKKKVKRLQGQVFLHQGGDRSPVGGATITVLVPGRTDATVRTGTTDADGRFAFRHIAPGTYRVRARHQTVLSVEAELTVVAGPPPSDAHDIVFEFGNDDDDRCYGGSVRIVDRR